MKSWFTIIRSAALTVRIHYTWLLLLIVGVWTLAHNILPPRLGETTTQWMLAFAVMLVYVGCVALHELGHFVAARALRVPMPVLNIHPIGTLARRGREDVGPGRTFVVAAAGPLANIVLWLILSQLQATSGTTQALLLDFARSFTFLLALINLLPGLPLDGGRMLRAAIWSSSTFIAGTRVATISGYVVAAGTLLFGLRTLANPATTLRGMWIVLLAWLIYAAGTALMRRRALNSLFNRLTARDVMLPAQQVVAPTITLRELVDGWGSNTGENPTPVVTDGRIVGMIARSLAGDVLQGYWHQRTVEETMQPIGELATVTPDTPLNQVLPHLDDNDFNPLPLLVVQDEQLMGMIDPREVTVLLDVQDLMGMHHPVPEPARISRLKDNAVFGKRKRATL